MSNEAILTDADQDTLARNAHIPTAEIERDIADTEYEIATMTREMEGFRMVGDRLSQFRADARRDGIQKRREFLEKLRDLLLVRESKRENTNEQ